jgi:hypothetical protein
MKNKRVDAGRVWKQVDDDVVPQLRLCVIDRNSLRCTPGKTRVSVTKIRF